MSIVEAPTYVGVAYPWHCDHIGHMNVMWYVGKFDEGSWTLLTRLGLSPRKLAASHSGMVALEQRITYHREVLAGDVLRVNSEITDVGTKVLGVRHRMFDSGTEELVAEMKLITAHIDTGTRRATPIPEAARSAAMALRRGPSEMPTGP